MAVSTYVGSFAKATATGNQDITIPVDLTSAAAGTWAIIFWTGGSPAGPGTWNSHIKNTLGFTTGAANSYAVGVFSLDASATSDTSRRMAAKCITSSDQPGTGIMFEADFVSFPTSSTMRLNWTTNDGISGHNINYMIISGLTGAKVVNWTLPTSVTSKTVPVTGVDLSNNGLVIHATAGTTSAPPESGAWARFGFGAMNTHGQQWTNFFISQDGLSGSNTARYQQTDACMGFSSPDAAAVSETKFSSMANEAFTVYQAVSDATAWQVVSLCMSGVSSKIGAFAVTPSVVSQVVQTRQGFTPKGMLFSNNGATPGENASPKTQAIWALGAYDGTNQRHAQLYDLDASATTNAKSVWRNNASIAINNTVSEYSIGSVSAISASDITIGWTTPSADAREVLYLIIGDAGDNTFPAKITPGAYTNSSVATAYPNQKKLVSLSTGMKWAVWTDSDGAKFSYSSDGLSWTEYASAQVAGWSNGSISCYVDSGNTERLAAVWKQSGAGGGRTNGYIYLMVGTFNTGRTTLTWDTANIKEINATTRNFCDLVVIPEGTGARVFTVESENTTVNNYVNARYADISNVGVLGAWTSFGAGWGTYGVGIDTFPSIDYDPVTKRLFAAWSAGTSGTGKGIRFRTASYSAGAWTWGSEVEVDNRVWVNNDYLWCIVRWDGTKAILGGQVYEGAAGFHNVLYEIDPTSLAVQVLYYNPQGNGDIVHQTAGGLAIDPGTRDIYVVGRFTAEVRMRRYNRSAAAFENYTLFDTTNDVAWVSVLYYNNRIEWIYTAGNNSPYSVRYDRFLLNNPQSGLTLPTSGTAANLNAGYTFKWSYYAPDAAAQTGWSFKRIRSDSVPEYWNSSTSAWQSTEVYNSGATTELTFSSGKWPVGQTYTWTVSVKNATGVSGYPTPFTVTDSNTAGGVQVEVGSFTKQSTAGFQDVTIATNLTQAAAGTWAVVFWMSGTDAASGIWDQHVNTSLGFAANGGGTISQYVVQANMDDGAATTQTTRRMAAAAISINYVETVRAEAELAATPFPTATTMRVNWTINTISAPWATPTINYMIISGLTGARVVNWTTPTTAINKAVTGVGFSPDLVLHGSVFSAAPPNSDTDPPFSFGAMNKHGQQWANGFFSNDAVSPSNTSRYQQTDACIAAVSVSEALKMQAHFVSMDADGFTVNFSTTEATARNMMSLCLDGVSSKIGAFNKTTAAAPAAQTIDSRHGFTPKGAIFTSTITTSPSAPQAQALWNLGATDGTSQRVSAFNDIDNANPTQADSVWRTGAVIDLSESVAATTSSVGAWTSATTTSFTLTFSPNSGNAGENLYLLLGDSGTNTFPNTVGV